jgi:Putative serine esterase (DUF676)
VPILRGASMLQIEHSGQMQYRAQTLSDGIVVRVSTSDDLAILLEIVLGLIEPGMVRPREGETQDPRLRALVGFLLTDEALRAEAKASLDNRSLVGLLRKYHFNNGADAFESLALALGSVLETWQALGVQETENDLEPDVFLLLAMPGREAVLGFDRPRSIITIRTGSKLIPEWAKSISVKTKDFVVGVGVKVKETVVSVAAKATHLLSPSARAGARDFVNRIRQQTEGSLYPRLDELADEEIARLRRSQLIIVLVHGLFATDRGTFDGLLKRLEQVSPCDLFNRLRDRGAVLAPQPGEQRDHLETLLHDLKERLSTVANDPDAAWLRQIEDLTKPTVSTVKAASMAIVGYPHNTLDRIESNGQTLASQLLNIALPTNVKIAFLCHSRGGLVARQAAAILRKKQDWHHRIDIITFGSPHEGAEFAEHKSATDIGSYLLAVNATRSASSLWEILHYLEEYEPEGIFDLRPGGPATKERPSMFLDRLVALEFEIGLPRLTVIGGKVEESTLEDWKKKKMSTFASWKTGREEHDMVVTAHSSLCRSNTTKPNMRILVNSDHFSYFGSLKGDDDLAWDFALARLWSRIDFPNALDRVRGTDQIAPSEADSGDKILNSKLELPGLLGGTLPPRTYTEKELEDLF